MKANSPLQMFKAIYRYAQIPLTRWSSKGKPPAYMLGVQSWKTFLPDWLPGKAVHRYDRTLTKFQFYTTWAPWILADKRSTVYVWSYKTPPFLIPFCEKWNVPYVRIEDGFIRSVALGAQRADPLSLCFDSPVLYFDATRPSGLENILQRHDFNADPDLLRRARDGIDRLISSRMSKYNVSEDVDIEAIYGPKDRKRILVVGQVEGDMSILKGCERKIDNNDLVRIACRENPGAQVIYKPHPEVMRGIRKDPPQSKPDEVRGMAMVLDQDVTLADAFKTVDHVYTITSLSGFEALIRGIKVTCVGMPFYAGWGATDDRQKCARRTARRTVEEIFAAAYILYPRYYDPILRKSVGFEEALDLLTWMKASAPPKIEKSEAAEPPPVSMRPPGTRTKDQIKAIRAVLDILDPPRAPQRKGAKKPTMKPLRPKRS